jgi:hypothetical protein
MVVGLKLFAAKRHLEVVKRSVIKLDDIVSLLDGKKRSGDASSAHLI